MTVPMALQPSLIPSLLQRWLIRPLPMVPKLCILKAGGAWSLELTEVSSEHDAMMFSMKGFHLMSSTLPW